MSAPVLIKRPVAFRVPRADQSTGGQTISTTEWRLFNDEAEARAEAEGLGVDYQALYARDGTVITQDPAEIMEQCACVADEMAIDQDKTNRIRQLSNSEVGYIAAISYRAVAAAIRSLIKAGA